MHGETELRSERALSARGYVPLDVLHLIEDASTDAHVRSMRSIGHATVNDEVVHVVLHLLQQSRMASSGVPFATFA
jgi:hypothetical protein